MGIDKLLTVPSCYGFSLATGGLIIGYFELFTNGLSILFSTKEPTSVLYILDVVFVLGAIGLLYGIHEKKPLMLLPNIILSILFICALFFILIMLLFGVVFSDEVIDGFRMKNHPLDVYQLREKLFDCWTLFALLTAFYWYLTSVKYSLYKSMQACEAKNETANQTVKSIV